MPIYWQVQIPVREHPINVPPYRVVLVGSLHPFRMQLGGQVPATKAEALDLGQFTGINHDRKVPGTLPVPARSTLVRHFPLDRRTLLN